MPRPGTGAAAIRCREDRDEENRLPVVFCYEDEQWSAPVIARMAQMFKFGPQILQLAMGAKYRAGSPDSGQEDWGLRVQLTFLFPK